MIHSWRPQIESSFTSIITRYSFSLLKVETILAIVTSMVIAFLFWYIDLSSSCPLLEKLDERLLFSRAVQRHILDQKCKRISFKVFFFLNFPPLKFFKLKDYMYNWFG